VFELCHQHRGLSLFIAKDEDSGKREFEVLEEKGYISQEVIPQVPEIQVKLT
jgi:hypothetical protein